MRHGVSFIALLVLALPAHAQDRCTEVHFERGQSSATIRGSAPAEDVVCYTFGAGAGQTANLKVTGRNVIVSVIGVGDARTSWTFKTQARPISSSLVS
jgi:hypothetical protein